jgi:Metal-dependent amidase/aminoacylase/carboxypeptidase
VINEKAVLKLSVRTLDPQVRSQLLERIQEVVVNQAASFGATASINHINGSPVLFNDPSMTDFAIDVARTLFDDSLIEPHSSPMMGSEDFAFMLEANPHGAYFFIGAGEGYSVHHPGYDFNDEIMKPAVLFWSTLAERFLSV